MPTPHPKPRPPGRERGFSYPGGSRFAMHVISRRIRPDIAKDLADTLARLRIARTVDDKPEIYACEKRLNWLLDRLPRKDTQ